MSLGSLTVLRKYFVKYKWRLLLGLLFVVASNVFAVLTPGIVGRTMNQVYAAINANGTPSANLPAASSTEGRAAIAHNPVPDTVKEKVFGMVTRAGLLLLAYTLLRGIFMFFMRQTVIVMSRHIEYDQKNEIFDHYQKLSTSFYKSNATGDLMSRISEDVSRVRMYTGPAMMYIMNLVATIVLSLWEMIEISPKLTLYVVAPLPLLAYSVFYVNKIVNRKSEKIQSELSNLTAQAQEAYSGIRVIKSFVRENSSFGVFAKASAAYRKSTINLSFTEAVYGPAMTLFVGLSTLLTILAGGRMVMQGSLSTGDIAEFVLFINMLTFPISAIGFTANMVQRAAVSQRRINEFLLTDPDIKDDAHAQAHTLKGKVDFVNVGFTYPHTGITALKNFNLAIQPGEKVAIIGRTGSGKSTIVNLLLRMYDASEGAILVDDIPIKQWQLESLRTQVSYVPQDVFLFSDTIANNIKLGNEAATRQQVAQAAQTASIDAEIEQLPDKYETVTGERGVMLSGGQKQRISIARAIVKKPAMLILDESLSAVDTRTEQHIQQQLKPMLEGKTTIVITHRIFKNWDFDKIVVLEHGQIAEQGTHRQLMELGGIYAELYDYQTVGNVR
ncbi:MAG: ABC transporter ATP-binding protein [Edaphocola sp.]